MRVVYSPRHHLHDPDFEVTGGQRFAGYEVAARASRSGSAEGDPLFSFEPPGTFGIDPIRAVHDDGLIAYLENAWQDWRARGTGASAIMPDAFPHPGVRAGMGDATVRVRRAARPAITALTPRLRSSRAPTRSRGSPVTPHSQQLTACWAASALSMPYPPPGRHSARAVFGGYCYLNQAAVAVEWLAGRTHDRIAVLDVDYHHGNGTQQIFYDREDILYASIHADPSRTFPYFAGHTSETGAGAGAGTTFNQPMPAGTSDAQYLESIERHSLGSKRSGRRSSSWASGSTRTDRIRSATWPDDTRLP